jgi:plasmid replication initiation protein
LYTYFSSLDLGDFEMANELITQDNALINSSYSLDLIEKRLIILAISRSRKSGKGITADNFLEIYAKDYEESFGVARQASYMALKDASEHLFDRYFVYEEMSEKGNIVKHKSRWVSQASYVSQEACVKIVFAPAVIPLIHDLEQRFTSYFLSDIASMTSQYAIRLYELIIAWRLVGETPLFELDELRQKLGVLNDIYPRMFDFKKRILDLAINQINEHSNIFVIAMQHKKGRVISGFSFAFKVSDEKTMRKKITKKQAESMANVGESYKDLYSRLSKKYLIFE